MVAALISDDLWNLIAPLLPPARPKPKSGRPRIPDRACLRGSCICPSNRHPLGDAPQGTGLRLWNDLLAPPAGLAGGGRQGFDFISRSWIGLLDTAKLIGLGLLWTVVRFAQFFLGATDRTESDRPCQAGQQASSGL
jgi:hypothetical protein